ncbi:class I SAM-dependent methyltransferase [Agromyces seonyuensis]|uniref:Methyltransferase domain-containing protein n=1 Tax=Agromyces seonyuensis TaxID=2662446 RepID=A0A6I4NSS4_9MICO|nr:class I SAM-dependent methyltransferase [Agromyces seonyuensis]MWB97478.1 methyltransferase domain-containing protein [Agromyces seonyuensis]
MDDDRTTALADRLAEAALGALELYSVRLGDALGLYRTLAETGPLTPDGLATAADIAPRYAREWCEQQAVAGILDALPDGRFALPDAHVPVLVDPAHPAHAAPFGSLLAGVGIALDELIAAYRTGTGVPYAHYGAAFRHGQAGINRPAFSLELPDAWLGAARDLVDRLRDAPSPRIADLGCGEGWSTIALGRAFPHADVVGVDLDPGSIEDAARHAAEAGSDMRFELADAASLDGAFDLVLILEALHDVADPVGVLRAARGSLADDGALLVLDERVADEFTAPGDAVERLMYGWSVLHCLPASMAEQPSAALGTVLRASTVNRLAIEAGFTRFAELPIEHDFFRLYRLEG